MRFKKWPRPAAFEDTPRKRAALERSQRNQREKLPLLATLIAEKQPDPDTVMAKRANQWSNNERATRRDRAQEWRRARALITTYPPMSRHRLLMLWRDAPYPADPSYLLDFIRAIENSRIDPDHPPWMYRGTPFSA